MITKKVALEVLHHEGIVSKAYKDSVGVVTWGVGVTNSSGHNVDQYVNNPQTLEHILNVYADLLANVYLLHVLEAFGDVKLSENQLASALSFHYNTGAIKKASWVKAYLRGDIADAKRRFMLWNKPKEITDRRKDECDLFFDGKWSNKDGKVTVYTEVTSRMTPKWSSAKRIDVSPYLDKIFEKQKQPEKFDWLGFVLDIIFNRGK